MNRAGLTITAVCCLFSPVLAADTLVCISGNNGFTHCDLPYRANSSSVSLSSVVSGNCDLADSWGVDTTGVWVNNGCGGSFDYTFGGQGYYDEEWHTYPEAGLYRGPGYEYSPGGIVFFNYGGHYHHDGAYYHGYHHGGYYHNTGYHGGYQNSGYFNSGYHEGTYHGGSFSYHNNEQQ